MTTGAKTAAMAAVENLTSFVYGWLIGFAVIAITQIVLRKKAKTPVGKALIDIGGLIALLIWTMWKVRHIGAS